ncbi:MAG: gas vesicle protein K [Ignavibacteriales bacterium]|nr:gas vesicle protein K [Ignavibacteriales bacterium]
MAIEIDEGNLKQGLLGLVITLVEIIQDALRHQAVRRMEGGSLTEAEMERLGEALIELDSAVAQIKEEMGLVETVKNIRGGLDGVVNELIDDFINPQKLFAAADRERLN